MNLFVRIRPIKLLLYWSFLQNFKTIRLDWKIFVAFDQFIADFVWMMHTMIKIIWWKIYLDFFQTKWKWVFWNFSFFWSYSALFTQLCFATTNLKSFRISSKSEKLSFWFCWLQIDFPCFCFYEMSLIMVNFVCSTFLSSYAVVPIPVFSLSKYEWNDACFTTSYPKLLVFSLLLSFQFSHWEGIEPTNNQITFTLQ